MGHHPPRTTCRVYVENTIEYGSNIRISFSASRSCGVREGLQRLFFILPDGANYLDFIISIFLTQMIKEIAEGVTTDRF